MNKQKMNLATIQGRLSRAEMKKITGGNMESKGIIECKGMLSQVTNYVLMDVFAKVAPVMTMQKCSLKIQHYL